MSVSSELNKLHRDRTDFGILGIAGRYAPHVSELIR